MEKRKTENSSKLLPEVNGRHQSHMVILKGKTGWGRGGGPQERCLGCAGFEMPIRYSNEDAM